MSEVEDLSPKAPQIDALKAEITFDEFTKMDLRVGLVLEASRIPKSDKLIHLTVDLGMERRTIVAGIGKAYEPETLINKRIVVIATKGITRDTSRRFTSITPAFVVLNT